MLAIALHVAPIIFPAVLGFCAIAIAILAIDIHNV